MCFSQFSYFSEFLLSLNSAAGCVKIPGILYPENSDFAKRSKYVSWRAAVESSTTVEQLALQVWYPCCVPFDFATCTFIHIFCKYGNKRTKNLNRICSFWKH